MFRTYSLLQKKSEIVTWAITEVEQNGGKHIASHIVRNFPRFFCDSEKANDVRARRCWRDRVEVLDQTRGAAISCITKKGHIRRHIKAKSARKTEPWTQELHVDLLREFERLSKAGVRSSAALLQIIAPELVRGPGDELYAINRIKSEGERSCEEVITIRWIQTFMERHSVVLRGVSEKFLVSPDKLEAIHREVERHVGVQKRSLSSSKIDEEHIFYAD